MKQVSFGLIGAGRWGQVYIRTILGLAERCRISHLATRHTERAALLPYPVEVVTDWRTLVRGACDAVIIASPGHTHAEILEACLHVGKPCIVEKPWCMDVITADRLHKLIERAGVPVLVDYTQLFHPAYIVLKQMLLARGEPIRMAWVECLAYGPFRNGIPSLWDWGSHGVSLCLDLLGERPNAIAALGGPPGPAGYPELMSLRLNIPGGSWGWILTGSIAAEKRRLVSVFTDNYLYRFSDLSPDPLTESPIQFANRYSQSFQESKPVVISTTHRSPMTQLVTTFLDGLAGGDRSDFGTRLARNVTHVLAQCAKQLGTPPSGDSAGIRRSALIQTAADSGA